MQYCENAVPYARLPVSAPAAIRTTSVMTSDKGVGVMKPVLRGVRYAYSMCLRLRRRSGIVDGRASAGRSATARLVYPECFAGARIRLGATGMVDPTPGDVVPIGAD
jgi:hypothetical protein